MTRIKAIAIAALAAATVAAQAQTYVWDSNGNGNVIGDTSAIFDASTQNMKWSTTVANNIDGFWLAVSPGPNPKGHAGELALLYFDATKMTPRLTAYAYNGVNGGTSWKDGSPASGDQAPDRIISSITDGTWINSLTSTDNGDGTKTFGFDINATAINGHTPKYPGSTPWTGAAFGDKIGVWYHAVDIRDIAYNSKGFIKNLHYKDKGWLDVHNRQTVPEPASMTLLALGGLALLRRRAKAKKA